MTYMGRSLHKNPCLVGFKIYNFDRPFLLIINTHFIRVVNADLTVANIPLTESADTSPVKFGLRPLNQH